MTDTRYAAFYQVVRSIPAGRVATYGQVAAAAGLPGRARLVGHALRVGPADLPWFRIVAAPGRIAFPPESTNYARQVQKLSEEGVICLGGRIDMQRFGWQADLDALLWGPATAEGQEESTD